MTTTISDLSQNLVEKILSRVPKSCLGAVRSTCKRWNSLSKVKMLCKVEARHQFLGFMMKKYKLCSMRFDLNEKEEGGDEFVDPSIKELGNFLNQVEISNVFQCDGLLLCVTKEDNTRLVVWNPYLGQTRWIQPRNSYHTLDRYAIGYDNNRQHKILRFLDDHDIDMDDHEIDMDDHEIYRKHVFGYEVYEFSSNSWRVLDIAPHWDIDSYQHGASLKGNTYFIAKDKIIFEEDGEIPEPADYILCFDFTTESFGQSLPLPFQHFRFDAGALSSLRDEKLAALYQSVDRSEVEIWVTTMIEPNALSWNPFLKVDMNKHYGSGFQFHYDGGSFFIDEEKKVAVVFHFEESESYEDAAYIIGDDGYVKKVCLGEAVNQGASLNFSEYAASCPLVCCGSFVPSLAHLNQLAGFKRKEKKRRRTNKHSLTRRLTIN